MLAAVLCSCLAFSRIGARPTLSAAHRSARLTHQLPSTAQGPTMVLDAPSLAIASTVPSLLGLWKRDYTVSYGYGGAMAWAGALSIARGAAAASPLALAHAILYVAYGVRLSLFLLYRETQIPLFAELRERIEARAPEGSRLKRLPFCFSVSGLYFSMAAPIKLTEALGAAPAAHAAAVGALIGVGYVGMVIAALGDLQKTLAKARGAGLVTGGLFTRLRHPNYTGESLLWLASTLAGVVAAFGGGLPRATTAVWTALSLVGCAGIEFVLAQATENLESKQLEKYGFSPAYEQWVRRSWSGFERPSFMRRPKKPTLPGDATTAGAA